MKKRFFWPLAALVFALVFSMMFIVACDDDDDDNDDADDDVADDDAVDDDVADDDAVDDDAVDDDTIADDDTVDNPFSEAEQNLGEWAWIEVDGAMCRDGSGTGFGLRLQEGAQKLMIYLQGGGACFDAGSCADNPDNFAQTDFDAFVAGLGEQGVFNLDNEDNSVMGWNHVFVPYCTGDVHSGSFTDSEVPGVDGKQQFVGYLNMLAYLELLAPYFADADQVLLSGTSAGGYGTLASYPQVADAFAPTQVVLLDDSGPMFEDNAAFSPLLQLVVRNLWGIVLPENCPEATQLFGDGLENLQLCMAEHYPDANFGFFSFMEDDTMRDFLGILEPVPADTYRQALLALRDDFLVPTGRWSTFYMEGTSHGSLETDGTYFTYQAGGVNLTDWVEGLLMGVPASVGP